MSAGLCESKKSCPSSTMTLGYPSVPLRALEEPDKENSAAQAALFSRQKAARAKNGYVVCAVCVWRVGVRGALSCAFYVFVLLCCVLSVLCVVCCVLRVVCCVLRVACCELRVVCCATLVPPK